MSKVAIARRRLDVQDAAWRRVHPEWTIDAARAAYDAGKVELAQGRDGNEAVLYLIERRQPDRRVPWFGRQRPPHYAAREGAS